MENRLYQCCALPFTREDVCPWNEQIGAFNEIVVNAQNVLVLTGKTDLNKSLRQDVLT